MTQFVNRFTGTEMWVADNRVEEYLAAGHKLAAKETAEKPEKKPDKPKKKAGTK